MHTQSALEIAQSVAQKKTSAQEVTRHFLKRIQEKDSEVRSFLRVYSETALQAAKQVDEKIGRGLPVGKLAGVPVAIKDNIHIEGEISTCGSRFLENFKAPFSATAIDYLLKEDAILIGKTNMDEFAMGSSTENSAYQLTKNPWDLTCTPGGSSGGSAAAVAARLVPLSLGSDTGGSVRQPAAFCGINGFKPTYGRVSRYGLVAYGSSLDQIGPFATGIQDLALLLSIIAQPCQRDATALQTPPGDFTQALRKDLKGITVGVPESFIQDLDEENKAHFYSSVETLKELGARIQTINLDILRYSLAVYYILATAEASTNLARFDGIRYGLRSNRAHSLEEIYELSKEEGFGKEVQRRILLGTFVLSAGHQDAYYRKAQQVRTLIKQAFEKTYQTCQLVALPTSPMPAFPLGAIHDPLQMYLQDVYTIVPNLAGIPAISIPSGFNKEKKPMSLQLMGPPLKDTEVIGAAYAFEQKKKIHTQIPPGF